MRIHGSDFVTAQSNVIHNNSRCSTVRKHGFVIHSIVNNPKGLGKIDPYDGYRIRILGNEVFENYNKVYYWKIVQEKGIVLSRNLWVL